LIFVFVPKCAFGWSFCGRVPSGEILNYDEWDMSKGTDEYTCIPAGLAKLFDTYGAKAKGCGAGKCEIRILRF
jgi:hypothetical protein